MRASARPFAYVAAGGGLLALLLFVALHFLSPEFDPSWRILSEYANGKYPWVLALLFAVWGVSTLALAFMLRFRMRTRKGKAALAFLAVAGLGQLLSAVFDINHPLHDLTSQMGLLGFPIGALLATGELGRTRQERSGTLRILAHLTWISVVLMIGGLVVMMTTWPADAPTDGSATVLPHGVIGVVGYFNRLLVTADCLWAAAVVWQVTKHNKA